jgi:hypothetical protein
VLPPVAWTTIEAVFEGNSMVRNSTLQVLGERAVARARKGRAILCRALWE